MKFFKRVLDNGLTVLFEKRDVPVTTVMLGVKYGSGYESLEEKGMAHFIEHLCFKGTGRRNTREIAQEVESLGGELNAFTHDEVTAYHVKLPSNYLEIAMDVVFDVFFNPVFPEEEVLKEGAVICEEIKMHRDNPPRYVFEKIKSNLYKDPFGAPIAGIPEVVMAMTRDKLKKRHDEVYIPENSVLSVVGNNDFEEIVSLAEKFSDGVVFNSGKKVVFPEVCSRVVKDFEKREGVEQANVALGFHFPLMGDNSSCAAEVFSSILGDGMSSRLFTEIREKRGLVYSIKSDIDIGKHYGYMVIWAGTDPSNVDEVLKVCLEEFHNMENLTEEDLLDAKIQVVGNRKIESEGSSETAINLILSEIRGKAEDYYEFENKVNKVCLEDIRKLARIKDFASFSLGP